MTSGTWRGVIGCNCPIQGVKSNCNPMFANVEKNVGPKEVPFNFLTLTYNGVVAKLTWPLVNDIKIIRGYAVYRSFTHINRWKFQDDRSVGVAMTSIQTFFLRWGPLTWPGNLTLCDLGLKFSHVRKRCMDRCDKKPPHSAPTCLRYLQKSQEWYPDTPGQALVN